MIMKKIAAALLATATFFLSSCVAADITVTQGEGSAENKFPEAEGEISLTVNISSGTFHLDEACRYAEKIKEENKKTILYSNIELALADGYKPCSVCAPEYKNMEENHD
jgi:hypothetical protein